MPINWSPFVEFVQTHHRFLLTTHVRPDGDGLGSMQALALTLRQLGKEVRSVITSVMPPRYHFLDPAQQIERFELPGERWRNVDAAIVLDTGTWNQLDCFAQFLRELQVAKSVIDHHQTQDDLGAQRFVDTSAEANGRLVYEAIMALGAPLTSEVAEYLFVALAMDTGWFRHSNTTAATFALAEKLVAAGARPEAVYDKLFEQNTLPRLKLIGLILDRMQVVHSGQIAHTELRRDDYTATGAVPQDSEDLVNYTRGIIGVEVGLFFMEQPRGGVKVSFRSRARVNVAKVAEQFGGGGHRLASGATLNTTLEEARRLVVLAVTAALDAAS
jgi:phosphoesterase RecJ-like protein